jgi:hypothetical protein
VLRYAGIVSNTSQYLNTKSLVNFARSNDAQFIETFYDTLSSIQSLRDSYFIVASINVIVNFPAQYLQPSSSFMSAQVIAFRSLQFLERHEQLSLVRPFSSRKLAADPPSPPPPRQLTRTLRASFKASLWFLVVFFLIFIGNTYQALKRAHMNVNLMQIIYAAFALTGFFLWRFALPTSNL